MANGKCHKFFWTFGLHGCPKESTGWPGYKQKSSYFLNFSNHAHFLPCISSLFFAMTLCLILTHSRAYGGKCSPTELEPQAPNIYLKWRKKGENNKKWCELIKASAKMASSCFDCGWLGFPLSQRLKGTSCGCLWISWSLGCGIKPRFTWSDGRTSVIQQAWLWWDCLSQKSREDCRYLRCGARKPSGH